MLNLYDSFDNRGNGRNIIWMGPTGVGKTGLATAFLIRAITLGRSGRFISLPELIEGLYQSIGDHSESKVIKTFASYDFLLIDELGYVEVEPSQVGLFFNLMQRRNKLVMHLTGYDFKSSIDWIFRHFYLSDISINRNRSTACNKRNPHNNKGKCKTLRLPSRDDNKLLQIRRYLMHRRCLPKTVVDYLINRHVLYADDKANAVDSDDTGERTAKKMRELYPMVKRLRPEKHDWNDVLRSKKL